MGLALSSVKYRKDNSMFSSFRKVYATEAAWNTVANKVITPLSNENEVSITCNQYLSKSSQ